jgi:hypothetical protein
MVGSTRANQRASLLLSAAAFGDKNHPLMELTGTAPLERPELVFSKPTRISKAFRARRFDPGERA